MLFDPPFAGRLLVLFLLFSPALGSNVGQPRVGGRARGGSGFTLQLRTAGLMRMHSRPCFNG